MCVMASENGKLSEDDNGTGDSEPQRRATINSHHHHQATTEVQLRGSSNLETVLSAFGDHVANFSFSSAMDQMKLGFDKLCDSFIASPAMLLDTRYFYCGVSLVHLILLYVFWSWWNVLFLLSLGAFHIGLPALLKMKSTFPDYKSLGEWAVVTGATDGIGKAYAFLFAKLGLNVVLISRNQEKLEKVELELRAATPSAKTKTVAMDFTNPENTAEGVTKLLEGLEVGILVNNVGMLYPNYEAPFLATKHEINRRLLSCNVDSMLMMTHAVLPDMYKRKRGMIINIGSVAADVEPVTMATYSASKAWVHTFTRCMAQEMAGSGVRIIGVSPGFVATQMAKGVPRSSAFNPTPKEFVESHLKVAGTLPMTSGTWGHELQAYIARVMYFIPTTVHVSVLLLSKYLANNRGKTA